MAVPPSPESSVRQEAEPVTAGTSEAAAPEPVSQEELNAWRRGFTPQAEIWNGRLAMLGLSFGFAMLLLLRLVAHAG